MNHRRKLTMALGAGALLASLPSRAQPAVAPAGKVWRIGFLTLNNRPTAIDSHFVLGSFLLGMRDAGYVAGKNLVIEWRFADGDVTRLAGLAADLRS